jgi:hypothetical protein
MAVRPAVEVRGISTPLLLAFISSAALALGVDVPMPTFCACDTNTDRMAKQTAIYFFMYKHFLTS